MKYIVLFLLLLSQLATSKTPVWIDYDIAFGKIFLDVDDGIALITALQSDDLDIKGISLGFGNIKNLNYMYRKTKKILRRLNRQDIRVFKGAKSKNDLFKKTAATKALATELEQTKGLVIMAMGRLTNVASLLKNYPKLKNNVKEVIINAGRRLEYETKIGKRKVIFPDTNVDDHLEAVRSVLESNVKITMIPVELMQDKIITKAHLKQMRHGNKISRWMANNSIVWRWIWGIYPRLKGFIPFDTFIVTYVTHRDQFYCSENIKIDLKYLKNNTSSLFRKKYKKKFKYFLVASEKIDSSYIGNYCYKIEKNHLNEIVDRWSYSMSKSTL